MTTRLLQQELTGILEKKSEIKDLYLFTVNHKTAPVVIREKFSIPEYSLTEANQNLKNYNSIKSFLILSTCNRTEIYFKSEDLEISLKEIYDFLRKYIGLEPKIAKEYNSTLKNEDVIKHVFRVASGLESLVLGETQVLSQLKDSYSISQKEHTLDDTLEHLFQYAINTAKEVHKKTNLSKTNHSISSAAIDLAEKMAGPLKTKSVMILGAGKMAKLALEHLVKVGGSKETIALNRSPHRVIEFSDKYKIDKTVPFENIYETLNDIDILVCAAGAPHFIIFAEEFAKIRKDSEKPLFIFDISMPRNIDNEFGQLPNVKLMDIDALQTIYNHSMNINNEDLTQAENIILNNINRFLIHTKEEETNKLIKDLKEKIEKIKKDKLTKLKDNKTSFTSEEVDYIVKNIINTIFHTPIKSVRNSNLYGSQKEKIEVLREIFRL